jgi:hypothetical protein
MTPKPDIEPVATLVERLRLYGIPEDVKTRLTKRQAEFLQECWANRRDHGTGCGGKVWDHHDALVANNLERMGLISQPPMYTLYLGAHLTEAGRDVLRKGAQ